ncbi:MAG: type II CRISPR RNA-guided endonuclease Cas9 [Chlorobiaceae bacterium]|nr:type II CRISPR RNA-guided endonuclease Cas9 [Chlorobiaceae bacterium]MBA4310952.1 type II CRISPR RNA-guided endonuclease Cas9 [Chlorobiaceae bacterium]
MKKILGLDLGVSSIGWAITDEDYTKILGWGSRIVPQSTDEKEEFTRGNAISKNQKRTLRRTQRKGYDRYQLRRKVLIDLLKKNNMLPDESLIHTNKIALWKLRADGVNEKLSLMEIGRVLLHLNQKRGYKSSRSEANLDKKETEYVAAVKSRHDKLKESGLTIGQKFYNELLNNQFYKIKEQVYPRDAYIEEFMKIMRTQQTFYPDLITDDLIKKISSETIYYQRNLKSQKSLVSVCEFEGFWTKVNSTSKEKELFVGPRVAHRSSPLFQVCKIWENINNISLKRKNGAQLIIPIEKKQEIFEHLDKNEKLTLTDLLKILELKKNDVYGNKQLTNGLQGNKTKVEILKCFENNSDYKNLFQFDLSIIQTDEEVFLIDKKTGEITNTKFKKIISPQVEEAPFYKLWHTIYSVPEKEDCKNALIKKFNLPEAIASKLAALDFTKQDFGNKSHRAIRKILPYLMEGDFYSDASSYAGYSHSFSLTKSENLERKLLEKLKPIEKNSLRQPVVEKILNQMVNVVNAVIDKHGKPDEIRIELARELKQSKEERNETFTYMNLRTKENEEIAKRLEEYGLRATRNNIIKWRLYHELNNEKKQINAICVYCGKVISFSAAIRGEEVDIEHIIPKSRLFDDSQSNKTLAHKNCNTNKNNLTAFDFMHSKSEGEFNDYIERVNLLYKNQLIGKAKRDKLLTPGDKIPTDFIDRQLRETQYISRKAREILHSICHNVWCTSGNVTSELRHIWGWDDVLSNIQLPKYRDLGLTTFEEIKVGEQLIKKEKIIGWSKRDDHRHHAIDALTIACTKQGFIQRLNNLNSSTVRDEMMREIKEAKIKFGEERNLVEKNILTNKPFLTSHLEEEAKKILVSFKAGKKVATIGKRKIKKGGKKVVVQSGIIVPRGALSEESVYGKISTLEKEKSLKFLFSNPTLILKPYIKQLVEERLYKHNNDPREAFKSLKKDPIFLDKEKTIELTHATCFKEEVVIKKQLQTLNEKQVLDIVDPIIKQKVIERLEKFGGIAKEAFKNLENDPVWYDEEKKIPINSVRCFTGLSAIEPIKKDTAGKEIAFVKPGNNHHLALYLDENGNKQFQICSFWHAVERKKYGFPVIIKNPLEIIDAILGAETEVEKYPDSFLEKLPNAKWKYLESFQQNEMFLLGATKEKIEEALANKNYSFLSEYLYRVQKVTYIGKTLDIFFRHHLETLLHDNENSKHSKRYHRISSLGALELLNPCKVKINCIGEIVMS